MAPLSQTGPVEECLSVLAQHVCAKQPRFTCYVAVRAWRLDRAFDTSSQPSGFSLVEELPVAPHAQGIPTTGPYVEISVEAWDEQIAAELAFSRVSGVLGAVAIFKPQSVGIRSRVVGVRRGQDVIAVDVTRPLPIEPRDTTANEIRNIVSSAKRAVLAGNDAVFDAIRHRSRAMDTEDPESRFMLLWFGIERLVLGAPGYGRTLESVRTIVPRAVALGKLRNEIRDLASAIETTCVEAGTWEQVFPLVGWKEPGARRIDRNKFLALLQGPHVATKQLIATFYEHDVRLVQWLERLRKYMAGSRPDRIVAFFEESRQRLEWQVLRLYRARNSMAHAGEGPSWLADLTIHANYYLTQLIAIIVHHQQRTPRLGAAEILARRAAQYDAFIALVAAGDARALQAENLLRPPVLVGT